MEEKIECDDESTIFDHNIDSRHATKGARNRLKAIKQYSLVSLHVDRLVEFQLILATFCTGVQDAVSYPDFRCFASNQTGNTVVLAVGIANNSYSSESNSLFHLPNVATSLCMFLAGAIITGQLGNYFGARRRLWQFVSNLVQTLLIVGAAGIHFLHKVQQTGPWTIATVALLAFSSGAQVAAARAFRIQEITTAMATAAWVDLVIDPNLFGTSNHPRNRRAIFLAALIAGSFAGAYAYAKLGSSVTLLISASGKAIVTAIMLVSKESTEMYEEPSNTIV
ncbi:hypothetical protein INT43_002205 [Umbelopsis isabellina]|uniref:DUF1275 domain protein n=1 Tax=Mortierella isabellina TaxID=91625 RepID=A0A8H7Q580_MORIS|nr:hypothetical protein INT43_002205 [Umbelopsis isabellina]